MKIEESKTARFFAGKGFMLVVAICLIAIGAAAYSTVNYTTKQDKLPTLSYKQESATYNSSEKMTTKQSENVPDERTTSQTESKTTKTETSEKEDAVADYFVLPIDGNIPKGFSLSELQYSATFGDSRLHTGIDIVAELGSNIKSAGKGKVTAVEKSELWGNVVEIDHGNGIVGSYCSIENVKVKVGGIVKAGQVIGTLGEIPCESSDAPHLHLSFKRDNEDISPLKLVGIQ